VFIVCWSIVCIDTHSCVFDCSLYTYIHTQTYIRTYIHTYIHTHTHTHTHTLADTLAKDAATNLDIAECYSKVPKSVVKRELEDRSVDKWQRDWNRSTKGKITKDYFPIVAERLKMKITTTHNFTTMFTGHGNIKAYLCRFKISGTPTSPCGDTDRTTDHLLYECDLLRDTKRHFKVDSSKIRRLANKQTHTHK